MHTCGLTAGGTVYCWGDNRKGQLGDGTGGARARPVAVAGSLAFRALSAGAEFACGLTTKGAAHCWGNNEKGQLGNGTSGGQANEPVAVTGGFVFHAISAGSEFACGLTAGGAAYCWGSNYHGQLGDGQGVSGHGHDSFPIVAHKPLGEDVLVDDVEAEPIV